ncbi:MAG: ribonuclease R, partial [Planctomycetes bacterium]|nr:ribonuclease R [Planctomycetota bacterium]
MTENSDVLNLIRSRRYRPMRAEELAEALQVPGDELDEFTKLLRKLELDGQIVQVKHRQYAWPKKLNLMVGKLDVNPSGFGFVRPLKPGEGEDVYVDEES